MNLVEQYILLNMIQPFVLLFSHEFAFLIR